tara:strand:- start:54 stop:1304 length:1251 start_codon:yes stop_codon:yes gene_type:complete
MTTKVNQNQVKGFYSATDYGVVGNGTTPDDDALEAAFAAAAGHTLRIYGTPLITRALTISSPFKMVFDGTMNSSGTLGSYFIKKSTLATTALRIIAPGFVAEGGGMICQAGNAGDGIRIAAQQAYWSNMYVSGAGQDGIRLGNDSGTDVIFGITLENPSSFGNGRHGIHVYDYGNEGNDHVLMSPLCQSNTQDGIRFTKSNSGGGGNLLIENMHCQANTGYGYFDDGGSRNTCILGDSEQNTAGDVYIAAACGGALLWNLGVSTAITNLSSSTTVLNSLLTDGAAEFPIVKFGKIIKSGEATAIEGTIAASATATITLTGFGTNGGAVLITAGAVGYGASSGTGQALFLYGPLGGGTAVGGTTISRTNTGNITISTMAAGVFTIANADATNIARFAVSAVGAINSSTTTRLTFTVT